MSVFLKWLNEELEKISENDIEAPELEIQDGEKVVAILKSTEVRKIYELKNRLISDLHQMIKRALCVSLDGIVSGVKPGPAEYEIVRSLDLLGCKVELLDKLFWTCVQHELLEGAHIQEDIIGCGDVGIRKDWQIVLVNKKEKSFEEALQELMTSL